MYSKKITIELLKQQTEYAPFLICGRKFYICKAACSEILQNHLEQWFLLKKINLKANFKIWRDVRFINFKLMVINSS